MTKLVSPTDPDELLAFEANLTKSQAKALLAKSPHKSHIEWKGPLQWSVRIRKLGFDSARTTYRTLQGAERAVNARLERVEDLGHQSEEAAMFETKEAGKTKLGDLLRNHEPKDSAEKSRINTFLAHPIANRTLPTLRPIHFEDYIDDRLGLGRSKGTVRREMNLIASILEKATAKYPRALPINPAAAKNVDYPSDSPARTRRLAPAEELTIRAFFADSERTAVLPTMFKIALSLGMRQGEIRDMTWDDIHRSDSYIYIPVTKTNRPRSVPLTDEAERAFFDVWLPSRRKLSQHHRIDLPNQVFWSPHEGKPKSITSEAIKSAWRRMREATGITNLTFHDLRHEATTRLFEEHGLSLIEVASVTGHRTTTLVERYTHLSAKKLATKIRDRATTANMFFSKDEIEFLNNESKSLAEGGIEEVVRLLVRQAMRRKKSGANA